MPDLQLLVGTSQGLAVLECSNGKATASGFHLPGEWITSVVHRTRVCESFLVTTRSGLLAELCGGECRPLGRLPGRACVSLAVDDQQIYVGSRPAQVYAFNREDVEPRSLMVGGKSSSSAWHSHSGGSALVSDLVCGRTGSSEIFCSIEVGGVLRSEDLGRTWEDVTANLDPDVHGLEIVDRGAAQIVATTGTGLFELSATGGRWSKVVECSLAYFQAVEFCSNREILVASVARAPFGRYSSGEFYGGSLSNEFGLLVLGRSSIGWRVIRQFKLDSGVLSRGLAFDPIDSDTFFAGDAVGRLRQWSCRWGIVSDVWSSSSLIECLLVASISPTGGS